MELNNEQLQMIERMSAAAFSIKEIAEVCEVDAAALEACYNQDGHAVRKAIRTGYLRRQLELRERIFKDAKNGSSPAQTIAYKLLEDVTIKNML